MKVIGQKNIWRKLIYLVPVLLIGALYLLLTQKSTQRTTEKFTETSENGALYCSAEGVNAGKIYRWPESFGEGAQRSTEEFHVGKYSVKVTDKDAYGFNYKIEAPEPGSTYRVSTWAMVKQGAVAYLNVEGPTKEMYAESTIKAVEDNGKGWKRLDMTVTLPLGKSLDYIRFFTSKSKGAGVAYFDDIWIYTIDKIKHLPTAEFNPPTIDINIPLKGQRQLDITKKRAFKRSIYVKQDEDIVKAFMDIKGVKRKIKLRYKGDWLDHMASDRPSYRIQLQDTDSWERMQTFSIQAPSTRGHLRAWVYRAFLKSEDILTPRLDYGFAKINDGKTKVYSYEEHFTKNLLEYQLRREGPILKMTEDRFWENVERAHRFSRGPASNQSNSGNMDASEIKPFDEKKTAKSPILHEQFIIAQNLLTQYKEGTKPASEVFDIEREATFLAITDICIAQHGLAWHNLRFYYNPVTSMLEPIGYDGYSGPPVLNLNALYAVDIYKKSEMGEPLDRVFYDPIFMEHYFGALYRLSNTNYINAFFAQINEGIITRQDLIRQDEPTYVFNKGEIKQKALRIQELILPYSNSLQIYTEAKSKDKLQLKVTNTHLLPIKVIGYTGKKNKMDILLDAPQYLLPPKHNGTKEFKTLSVPIKSKYLMYQLPGVDSTFYRAISPWTAATKCIPRQGLTDRAEKGLNDFIIGNHSYTLKSGAYTFNHPIYIPKGKKLIIEEGTKLNFRDSGLLIVNGPIEMKGSFDQPIHFGSQDGKSGAIVVLQSKLRSKLSHVIFDNQNTMHYNGWNLTGAVTFYESDVDIADCQFNNNQCEDALNIVRCDFKVIDCSFENVFSDAFDSDYSTGIVNNAQFDNIGNDAIDFSTSIVEVTNCQMTKIGDKGISGGENATINAANISIDGANIGFAAKDLSQLTLANIQIKNCRTGFTAFQKKPEYGPANISVKSVEKHNIDRLNMIENGSSIKYLN